MRTKVGERTFERRKWIKNSPPAKHVDGDRDKTEEIVINYNEKEAKQHKQGGLSKS